MALTFTRTGVAEQRSDAGIWTQVATGVIRDAHYVGALRTTRLDPTRTQRFWNSDAPATQTRSIAAGTYVCWLEGSGSIVLSGGPTGTVTEGNPVVFTLGGTTSVTFTVSGTVTVAQCEQGKAPSSFIRSAGADVTRGAERLTIDLTNATCQDMTFYADLYEVGDTGFGDVRVFHFGATVGTTPYWAVASGTSSDTFTGKLHNGTLAQNTPNTGAAIFGQRVEIRAWIDTTATRTLATVTINGGVEGATVQSATMTMPGSFSQALLHLGGMDLASGEPMSIAGVALALGIQDLDTMRDIAVPVNQLQAASEVYLRRRRRAA